MAGRSLLGRLGPRRLLIGGGGQIHPRGSRIGRRAANEVLRHIFLFCFVFFWLSFFEKCFQVFCYILQIHFCRENKADSRGMDYNYLTQLQKLFWEVSIGVLNFFFLGLDKTNCFVISVSENWYRILFCLYYTGEKIS